MVELLTFWPHQSADNLRISRCATLLCADVPTELAYMAPSTLGRSLEMIMLETNETLCSQEPLFILAVWPRQGSFNRCITRDVRVAAPVAVRAARSAVGRNTGHESSEQRSSASEFYQLKIFLFVRAS